ncbi:MFS transporter [Emcibacter nanhaiensis]|uniref:MFS transporter n=1 Tax=Emcibacter nanhaiensis TaxID=1505037 RepID=A0A501PN14_9PROT|nr:MFS transporter [Emcibacter nanhaiensis]TPD61685.1 MFS transporter [Emcibacter nanhaiensis]
MLKNQFHLLAVRRFLPLFLVQFFGAFNDNLFKNALVILITYRLAADMDMNVAIAVTAAQGIFILPFFLFSALAGQLADKFEKTALIRKLKLVEIALMLLAGAGFWIGQFYVLMLTLFLMGCQSSFFGPLKYGILPDHLSEDELIAGNALVGGSTFLAILLGTIIGGLSILGGNGALLVSALVILVSVAGFIAARAMPWTGAASPDLALESNILRESWIIMKHARGNRAVFHSIMGISWFWLLGATVLAQFPALTRTVLGGDEQVGTLFLAAFSVGIGLGALLCHKLLRGIVSARYVPLAALGMGLFCLDLYLACQSLGPPADGSLLGIGQFAADLRYWRIFMDCLLISIFGGLYIVPLYALLQDRSDPALRSRMVAANNIFNAVFMVLGALVTMALLAAGLSIPGVFLALGLLTWGVAYYIFRTIRPSAPSPSH